MEEAKRRANERSLEESSYDDNELLEITPSPIENIKPVRKSKIPRLAKPDRGLPPEKTPEVSLEIVQRSTDPDMEEHVRTAASKMAGEQQSKLLKKLAEIKFKEELDYVQRKVQKTMGIVHLKGREERIREIELELEEKIRTGNESRSGLSSSYTLSPKTLNPLVNNEQESISELKQHIKKEMAIQREEMETFRKSIKNEISQAMEESYRRNEELWQLIKLMNEEKRSSPFHSRQNRPYSDGDELYRLPKVSKRLARRRRTSADDYEEPESDTQYNGQR